MKSKMTYGVLKGCLASLGCRVLESVGEVFEFFVTRRAIVHRSSKLIKILIEEKNVFDSFIFDTGAEFVSASLNHVVEILRENFLKKNFTGEIGIFDF